MCEWTAVEEWLAQQRAEAEACVRMWQLFGPSLRLREWRKCAGGSIKALVAYLCSDGLLQAYTAATRKRLSIATACLTTSRAKLSSSSAYSEWPSWRLRVASANYRVARLRNRSASSMSRSSRHL